MYKYPEECILDDNCDFIRVYKYFMDDKKREEFKNDIQQETSTEIMKLHSQLEI